MTAGLFRDEHDMLRRTVRAFVEKEVAPHVDGESIRYVGPVGTEQRSAVLGGAHALLHLIGLPRGQFPVSVRSLSEAEGLVLAAILKRSGSIEELVPRVKLPTSLLAATLTMLEARGLVTAYSGATFHATLEARRSGWGTKPTPPVSIEVGA